MTLVWAAGRCRWRAARNCAKSKMRCAVLPTHRAFGPHDRDKNDHTGFSHGIARRTLCESERGRMW